jgi:ElaB/YqjD/DUF883 family membrane-anchored ribosome-binding protein
MAKPLRSSADVPEFDTYPAKPQVTARIAPERELPPPARDPRLERQADKLGTAIGETVAKVRQIPQRMQEMPDRVRALGEQLRGRAEELREDTREAIERGMENLKSSTRERLEDARHRAAEMRQQANEFAREKPFHVIAGVAIAAFALGIGLRIWRSM